VAKKKQSNSIVKPSIVEAGKKHVLETMFDSDKAPVIKSIGYKRLSESPNSWVSYVITSRGKEILDIQVEEPNVRGIAEDSAKVAFVTSFMDQELF